MVPTNEVYALPWPGTTCLHVEPGAIKHSLLGIYVVFWLSLILQEDHTLKPAAVVVPLRLNA